MTWLSEELSIPSEVGAHHPHFLSSAFPCCAPDTATAHDSVDGMTSTTAPESKAGNSEQTLMKRNSDETKQTESNKRNAKEAKTRGADVV